MTRRLASMVVLTLGAFVLLSLPASSHGDAIRHISLVRSFPAKDTVLAQSPVEIRLTFSGVPREKATAVRLLNAAGEAASAHVMPMAPDSADGKIQVAQIHGALQPGAYSVAWNTIAGDGATARGTIPFTVRAP